MDKISIIVPVYNVEEYLDECVMSIRRQTYANLEILLIDDGSTDKSGMMCDQYAKEDHRIKVIHKKNGGQSDARNVGLDNATGRFIGFVDSDDYIDDDMYELLYKNINESFADISMCKGRLVEGNRIIDRFAERKVHIFDKKDEMMKAIYLGEGVSVAVWQFLYKKEIFDNLRFRKGVTSEDALLSWDVLVKTNRMVLQKISKYSYRQRIGSTTHIKRFEDKVLDVVKVYSEVYQKIKKYDIELVPIAECRLWWSYRTLLGRMYELEDYHNYYGIIEDIKGKIYKDKALIIKNKYFSSKQKFLMLIVYMFPNVYCWLYRTLLGR